MLLSIENMIVRKRVGERAAVDMLADAGFTGIDYSFCMMEDWEETINGNDSLSCAEDLREYAGSRGVTFCQSHAPFRFRAGMKMDESEYEYYRIVKSMEFAAAMKIPMIVVHALMTEDGSDELDLNERYYSSLLPYAEKYGIKIAVENLTGRRTRDSLPTQMCLGNPEKYCEMQDRLNSPYICGCLDIGHANLTTHDPAGFIRACKGYVHYIHTHDNNGVHDRHCLPSLARWFDEKAKPDTAVRDYLAPNPEYSIPWDDVLSALKEIGYSGPFNLELLRYMECYMTEDLPAALGTAASVGRRMMAEL
ncbi:MAG: sugar phosphate isomerase/epimerase [Lachnospiraceae bacterium]|nr:sugar phosphate isomerase/epimerase [Lachnospiraceae bacterium]